jgi:adenine-specific DNA-methyltransferase
MSENSKQPFSVPSTTLNLKKELSIQLSQLLPEVLADGKIDFEKLKEILGEDLVDERERFGMFWPGKKRALRAAQEATSATLTPVVENSRNWDSTGNLFIEGDNLEVLKILQKHYHRKLKMIYVDPPYNTGKDFIYPDNYKEGLDSYLEWTKQVNEEGKKVSTNSESEGRFHSNWLNMMYPRLKLARNLLSDDGVIFISIDDNEQDNLKKLCNEIFGEANFVAELPTIMNLKGNNDQFGFAGTHEYTFVYARKIENLVLGQYPIDEEGLEEWESDERGQFKRGANLKATGTNAPRAKRPNLYFPIYIGPDLSVSLDPVKGWTEILPITDGEEMSWRWSRDKFRNEIYDVIVLKAGDGFTLYKKQRPGLGDIPSSKPKSTFYKPEYSSGNGTAAVKELFDGKKVFDNPKPLALLRDFLLIGSSKECIVMDLFAGSASLAHAVLDLNRQDGGNRKTISIQLPEPVGEDSEAEALGYRTIADVARSRIKKAAEKFEAQLDLLSDYDGESDYGFRSFKLTDTNFTKWQATSEIANNALEQHILDLRESANNSATPSSLLFEILLKQGYSLSEKFKTLNIDGIEVQSVGDNLLIAYLNEGMKPSLAQFKSILDLKPARFAVLEDVFSGDDQLKTNLAQECKSRNIELWTA